MHLPLIKSLPRLGLVSLLAAPVGLWAQHTAPKVAQAVPPGAGQRLEEPVYTLEQLSQLVLAHNPELLAAQRAQAGAQAGVTSASALPNPRLDFGSGTNAARLSSGVPGQVQVWGLSQLIESPAVRVARLDSARALAQGSAQHIAMVRNELGAQVQLKAYEYLLRRAEADAAHDAVTLLEQVRERVRLRVESGEAARYEIIKADAEIINARQKQQTANLMAEQSRLALNRLAAGQLPAHWGLAASLLDDTSLSNLEQIQQQAQTRHPEVLLLQSQVERARAQLQGARASRLPGLELRYSELRDPEIRQGMLGVSIQIPLLDQRAGPIAEAIAEQDRLQGKLDGRQAELMQQVLQAWKSLEMARLRVEALSQGAVREAEAALRVAQAAYRFGERGILDVLDAQRVLRTVRADLLDARFQVQAARIELEYLGGRYARPTNQDE